MNRLKFSLGVSILIACMSTSALVYSSANKIITAEIRADYVTNVDGVRQQFFDANGNEVFPILYDGSTYIPLRSVGNLMNKNVSWDGVNNVINLDNGSAAAVNTTINTINNATANGYITEEQAKQIALSDAGITNSSDVIFLQVKFEIDDRIPEYSVEFYVDNKEYDYEIHALTGAILEKDMDIEWYTANSNLNTADHISVDSAKQIAATHAGQSLADMGYVKVEYDIDKGVAVYDVEWTVNRVEYDYTINAVTGAIMEYDIDRD